MEHVLPNGLKIVLVKTSHVGVHVQATVGVGSVHETDGQRGFAHLVEHMMFEGTEKRPSAQIISSEIENLGGDINAHTTNEHTTYYVQVLGKHVSSAIDVLADILQNSVFDPAAITKEQNVVVEEIKLINDQPRYYQWILFEREIFKNSQYAWPVYGKTEDVLSATRDSLQSFYKNHYTPDNCLITLVGNIQDEATVLKQLIAAFENWTGKYVKQTIPPPKKVTSKNAESRPIQQVYTVMGTLCPAVSHPDAPVLEIIDAILGKPLSGRIYDEIRNKRGLAYDVGVSFEPFSGFSVFSVNITTTKEKVEESLKAIREVLQLSAVSEQELQDAKQYVEGRLLLELESLVKKSDELAFWISEMGEDYTQKYLEKVKAVTLQDINRVAQTLSEMTVVQLHNI